MTVYRYKKGPYDARDRAVFLMKVPVRTGCSGRVHSAAQRFVKLMESDA